MFLASSASGRTATNDGHPVNGDLFIGEGYRQVCERPPVAVPIERFCGSPGKKSVHAAVLSRRWLKTFLALIAGLGSSVPPKSVGVEVKMMKLFLGFFVYLLALWTTLSVDTAMAVEERNPHKAAITAVLAGDAQRAIELLTEAIKDAPNDWRYYNDRGVAYKKSGNLELALADYSKAIQINPTYTHALNNRGLVYLEQGLYDQAIQDFSEALKHGGLQSKIYTNMGLARARKGDHLAAIKDFDKAFTFRPLDYRSFVFMAESLEKTGETDRALKTYQLARGLIDEPQFRDLIDKKIASIEITSSRLTPLSEPASNPPSTSSSDRRVVEHAKGAKTAISQPTPVRQIARARPLTEPVIGVKKPIEEKTRTELDTPQTLEKSCRRRAIQKLSPASAEIYGQGIQFVDKADLAKALVRFEDVRQLERRNKNVHAVAWSDLEIGRLHKKMGDYVKADAYLSASLKMFEGAKVGDETILAMIELASTHSLAGGKDRAMAFFSKAAGRAVSEGHHKLALVIGQMAEGKAPQPAAKQRPVDSSKKSDQDKDNQKRSASAVRPAPVPITTSPGSDSADQKARAAASSKETASKADTGGNNHAVPASKQQASTAGKLPSKGQLPTDRAKILRTDPATVTSSGGPNEVFRKFTRRSDIKNQPERIVITAERAKTEEKTASITLKNVPGTTGHGRRQGVDPPPAGKHSTTEQINQPEKRVGAKATAVDNQLRNDLAQLRELRKKGDEPQMIIVLERLAERFSQKADFEKSLYSLTAALSLRDKLYLYKGIGRPLTLRGATRETQGKLSEALEDFTRASSVAESGNGSMAASLGPRISTLCRRLGVNESASREAYAMLWKARNSGDTLAETQALFFIGKIYDKAERHAEALAYYERSSACMLAQKARIVEKMGKIQLAEQYYGEALEILKNLDYSGYINIMRRSRMAGSGSQH